MDGGKAPRLVIKSEEKDKGAGTPHPLEKEGQIVHRDEVPR